MSTSHTVDLGEFVLDRDRPLGRPGGQGSVYVGTRKPPLVQRVAIKQLHEAWSSNPQVRAAFLREAQTYARLKHPNIVDVYGYGEPDGRPFIALEYIDGWDLRTWLEEQDRDHPIPYEITLLLLRSVGLALAHAHTAERPVAHRDIKPSNVMLSRDGLVKLMDFGLAQTGDVEQSITGELKGSPPYMSPEQTNAVRLEPSAARRSDLFSMGTLAYELFVGTNPFLRKDAVATMAAIRDYRPRPIDAANPLLFSPLARSIDRLLEKDPEQRGSDIGVLIESLELAIDATAASRPLNLLRDYVRTPELVSTALRKARIQRFLDIARGTRATDASDSIAPERAYRAILFDDPSNEEARAALQELTPPLEECHEPQSVNAQQRDVTPPIEITPFRRRRERFPRTMVVVVAGALALTGLFAMWRWSHHDSRDDDGGATRGSTSKVDSVSTTVDSAQKPQPKFRHKYLVNTLHGYAEIRIDDGLIHRDHRFSVDLEAGVHRFHLRNTGMRIDRVLTYTVTAGDSAAKQLDLDYRTGTVTAK